MKSKGHCDHLIDDDRCASGTETENPCTRGASRRARCPCIRVHTARRCWAEQRRRSPPQRRSGTNVTRRDRPRTGTRRLLGRSVEVLTDDGLSPYLRQLILTEAAAL